jgi:hypothetical protein
LGIIPLIGNDFSDDTTADKRGFGRSEKKNRFYARHLSVGVGNGLFKFKICGISQSSDDKIGLYLFTKVFLIKSILLSSGNIYFFSELVPTPMMISSKRGMLRWMMSRWPKVMGSKEPGKTARFISLN